MASIDDMIEYGFAECRFGEIIVARSYQGVCDVQFLDFNRMETIHQLAARWGVYTPTTQNDTMANTVKRVLFDGYDHPLKVEYRGNEFAKRVWREIQQVPRGETISYTELATRLDALDRKAEVREAVMANPMAVLIPCHRIIEDNGAIGSFHWGSDLKRALLRWEGTEK